MKEYILIMGLLLITSCSRNVSNVVRPMKNIVCFGNSLTAGTGAEPEEAYPAVLSRLLGIPVINAGVSGDTTRDALARLEKDVLARKPDLVIIEFGANDLFQQIPYNETLQNLEQIVDTIHSYGAQTILLHVKLLPVGDPYLSGMKDIARRKKAGLLTDILKDIITKPELRSDDIHPNAKGYAIIAERVYDYIIRKSPRFVKRRFSLKEK